MYNKGLLLLLILLIAGCTGGEPTAPNPPDPIKLCDAVVSWEPPTERTDGTNFTQDDISKYTIFISSDFSVDQSSLEREVDINDQFLISWTIDNIEEGEHWFYMTVTDLDGIQSGFSNIISKIC